MDEAEFRAYIAEFNAANFDALARCYAEDVAFSFNGGRWAVTVSTPVAYIAVYPAEIELTRPRRSRSASVSRDARL